jgi:hypothetical protein
MNCYTYHMKQLLKTTQNCIRELFVSSRSVGEKIKKDISPTLDDAYTKTTRMILKQPEDPGRVFREILKLLNDVSKKLADIGAPTCNPDTLDTLRRTVDRVYPLPIIEREKAKPTIRFVYQK